MSAVRWRSQEGHDSGVQSRKAKEPSRQRGVGPGRRCTVGSQSEGYRSERSDGADRMGGAQFS